MCNVTRKKIDHLLISNIHKHTKFLIQFFRAIANELSFRCRIFFFFYADRQIYDRKRSVMSAGGHLDENIENKAIVIIQVEKEEQKEKKKK